MIRLLRKYILDLLGVSIMLACVLVFEVRIFVGGSYYNHAILTVDE